MDIKNFTITSAQETLGKKECSKQELFDAFRKEIDARNPELNAYTNVFDYEAGGANESPISDVPCVIKDNILVDGKPCTAGSKILENYTAPYDATVIKKLRNAGSLFLGKGNLDEFAMGSTGEHSAFGVTKNPHDITRVAGGSSSGPAAAVGAGLAVFGLGSETNGSIRMPAAWCGVVGLKPTYGRVSRSGLIAFGSSLDQIGPITKTVKDAALVMNVIAGIDEKDSTTVEKSVPDYTSFLQSDIKGLKVAVPKEFFVEGMDKEVKATIEKALKQLEDLGAHIDKVSLPTFDYALAAYYIIAPSEASANLARYDGIRFGHSKKDAESLFDVYAQSRAEGLGAEVRRRIMVGTYALSAGYYDAYYLKAQKVRTLVARDMDAILEKYDVIAGPVNATQAPLIGEFSDPLSFYLADVYMTPACLAGLPSISVPCKVDYGKLPVGLQITGKAFDEGTVLRTAHSYEQSINHE